MVKTPDTSEYSDIKEEMTESTAVVENAKSAIVATTETEAAIVFLMGLDFKKHVDLLQFVNLPGFHLTGEEQATEFENTEIMKVLKIMLHQFGIIDELQSSRHQRFLQDYE